MAKVRKTWDRKEISLETRLALLRVCVFMSCTLVNRGVYPPNTLEQVPPPLSLPPPLPPSLPLPSLPLLFLSLPSLPLPLEVGPPYCG